MADPGFESLSKREDIVGGGRRYLSDEAVIYHFVFCTNEAKIVANGGNETFANMISRHEGVRREMGSQRRDLPWKFGSL